MTSSHSIKLVFNGIIIHLHFSLKNKTIHSTWLQRTFQKEGMFFILNIVMSRALLKNQDYINFSVPFWIILYLKANRFILSMFLAGKLERRGNMFILLYFFLLQKPNASFCGLLQSHQVQLCFKYLPTTFFKSKAWGFLESTTV